MALFEKNVNQMLFSKSALRCFFLNRMDLLAAQAVVEVRN